MTEKLLSNEVTLIDGALLEEEEEEDAGPPDDDDDDDDEVLELPQAAVTAVTPSTAPQMAARRYLLFGSTIGLLHV